jgi:hypothetical protein
VAPKVATIRTCTANNIKQAPYYSDCRWKTQNVEVDHNNFNFNPSRIGSSCNTANHCGFQGLFSNWRSIHPSWSPYLGAVIEQAITFRQHNVFRDNIYTGPWLFVVRDQRVTVDPAQWQTPPYNQDAGSTFQP